MFWFDPDRTDVLFLDKRVETIPIDQGTPGTVGRKDVSISPNIKADFAALPFRSSSFQHVVFDPPHIRRDAAKGIFTRKYGFLSENFLDVLELGFRECFRVLAPGGTLIFKWSDADYPLADVLKLTDQKPLYGHRSGKAMGTHWVAFVKE